MSRRFGSRHWKRMQQNSIQQSTTSHKHKNSKSISNNIQRSSLSLDWLTPIVIKAEKAAKLHTITRKSRDHVTDYEVPPKDWLHPADSVRITEQKDEHAIQVFTNSSKNDHGVGAGIAIFIHSKLEHRLRFTLHNRFSNNQTEQLAIFKALETIETLHINDIIPRTVTVHTHTAESPQSLKNPKNHSYLIEEIRKKTIELEKRNWRIIFTWIKAHAGNYGNELADKVAKEAARNDDISLNRIPKSEIAQQVRQSIAKWQIQWDRSTKGLTTKQFFPIIKDKLTTKIKLTTNFTAIVTAHGKTKAYLRRFKIIVSRVPL